MGRPIAPAPQEPSILQATNTTQQIAKIGEQVGEFLLPVGAEKTATSLLGTLAPKIAQGTSFGIRGKTKNSLFQLRRAFKGPPISQRDQCSD